MASVHIIRIFLHRVQFFLCISALLRFLYFAQFLTKFEDESFSENT